MKTPNNDLDLGDGGWKHYPDLLTSSFWNIPHRDASEGHDGSYHGNFLPQIPNQMLRRFTREGEWVLDPFAGSGTTLVEAVKLGRNVLGVDLNEAVLREGAERACACRPDPAVRKPRVLVACADSQTAAILEPALWGIEPDAPPGWDVPESVQHVIYHPPYHNIVGFTEHPADLSNTADLEEFLGCWENVLTNTLSLLDPGRHCSLVIGDYYAKGEWVPLGFECMSLMRDFDLTLKGICVKNFGETKGKTGQHALWRYRALQHGTYMFGHEYVILFEKPLKPKAGRRRERELR